MDKVKKILNRIFIDGLGAMGFGLFGTLIIGTIIEQIGNLI
ncbi:MAG TPA: PTS sugar transporter subunit IIC, partial [Candidatus Caccomorpha excrementavium]|nr:PTS sugar transporter subunit IIC [Candidatus Caccomorpha excrementavium]